MHCLPSGPRRFLALGLLLLGAPVAAAGTDPSPISETADSLSPEIGAPDDLRPGSYRWHPEAAPGEGAITIVVSLPLQRAYVFRDQILIGVSTISSGQPGYDTPTGTFRILQKNVHHRSNLYDNAPMPYMQRLTWDGIALHAGAIPGEPASHGCVRLPLAFARRLYAATRLGAVVTISDEAPSMPEQALTLASAE